MDILHNMIFILLFKGKLKERDQKMIKEHGWRGQYEGVIYSII